MISLRLSRDLQQRFDEMKARTLRRQARERLKAYSAGGRKSHAANCAGCRKCQRREAGRKASATRKSGVLACNCGKCRPCVHRASTEKWRRMMKDRGLPVEQWWKPDPFSVHVAETVRMLSQSHWRTEG